MKNDSITIPSKGTLLILAAPFVLALYVMARNAFLIDDTYITLRTVDNFLNGYGLRWNVDERVQTYSNPLWMFLLTAVIFFTKEFHVTTMALSYTVSILAVCLAMRIITFRAGQAWLRAALFLLFYIASYACLDFSSSGLENPLSYLLFSCFIYILIFKEAHIYSLIFLASLLIVTRVDNLIYIAPTLFYLLFFKERLSIFRQTPLLLLAVLPVVAWFGFAFFYYGFLFPSPAYGKLFYNGQTQLVKFQLGFIYLINNVVLDWAAYLCLISGCLLALKNNRRHLLCVYSGIFLHMVYVLVSAASANHMGGRFFATDHFIGFILFFYQLELTRSIAKTVFLVFFGLVVANMLTHSQSSLYFGLEPDAGFRKPQPNAIDIKRGIYQIPTWDLSGWSTDSTTKGNKWMEEGKELRRTKAKSVVGGAMGYRAFYAGPDVFVIDRFGLTDPLLSRLYPVNYQQPLNYLFGTSGHYKRPIPEGYIASVEENKNLLKDADLKQFYEAMRIITRYPIFDSLRLKTMLKYYRGDYEDYRRRGSLELIKGGPKY